MNKEQKLLLVGEAVARDLIDSYISNPNRYPNGPESLVKLAETTAFNFVCLSLNFEPTKKQKQTCSNKAVEDIKRYIAFAKTYQENENKENEST